MSKRSMGELISQLRREKGMTQRELAEKLNVTDKAVSKWERDLSCPDTASLPLLAEILGTDVESLLNAKVSPLPAKSSAQHIIDLVLKAVPAAMGIAVVVSSALGQLDTRSGFMMLGIGLAAVGIHLLSTKQS